MSHRLKRTLFGLAFNIAALFVTIELLESVTYTGGWPFFIITGLIIGLLNALVKPVLKFLSIPFIFLSGGLFLIIINAIILWLTDEILEILDFTNIDLQVDGIVNFVLAAIIFGITNWFAHWFMKRSR